MPMKPPRQPLLHLLASLLLLFSSHSALALLDAAKAPPAPEFSHQEAGDWINSPPLRLADLRGQVVLLDVWTFDCWNCYRSFPWLQQVEKRFSPAGLRLIGIHSPEFAHEKVRANVMRKIDGFGIRHPVMMDNDHAYWRALRNRYWPSYYLIDRRGRLRAVFFGETHAGDRQAREIEQAIQTLLDEAS